MSDSFWSLNTMQRHTPLLFWIDLIPNKAILGIADIEPFSKTLLICFLSHFILAIVLYSIGVDDSSFKRCIIFLAESMLVFLIYFAKYALFTELPLFCFIYIFRRYQS